MSPAPGQLKPENRSRTDLAGACAQRILVALDVGQQRACAGHLAEARTQLRLARGQVAKLDSLVQAILADMAAWEQIADGITGDQT